MRTYQCDPALEVSGPTTLSFVNNIGTDSIHHLIEKFGFNDIDTAAWYPVSNVFALFNAIVQENGGNTQPFIAMGMKIAEQSTFPDDMKDNLTLPMILEGWDMHYKANHRGADFPPVDTVKLDDTHYQLKLHPDHIYPYDLVYGMAYGFCRLLLKQGTNFKVKYVDGHNPYMNAGEVILVDVTWDI